MTASTSQTKSNTINHNALKHLIEAHSVKVATAMAEGDTWILTVVAGDTKKTVMAKNSGKARIWRKLETLTKYLKGLGLDHFIIDATNFDPSQKSLQRPDSAAILKRTHQAHKVQRIKSPQMEDILEVETTDTPITESLTPHRLIAGRKPLSDEVKERWEERRAKILKQENPRAK
jgi:hypothetical protein